MQNDAKPTHALPITDLGLTENEVVDTYIYVLGRYLVIRQEHIDIAEEAVDYNVIKFNELGKAEFVNPNLDVAYLEAWFAVDETTPVVLEVPKVEGRYYTAQIVDEWADILYNINERMFPDHPHGRFALCLTGSNPTIPDGALRIDLPSRKAKMLARVERKGDDQGAVSLQHQFKLIKTREPNIVPAVEIPMFSNRELITVDAFAQPMLDHVLNSAPDKMKLAPGMQKEARDIAVFVAKAGANRAAIDAIIKQKALPALVQFIRKLRRQARRLGRHDRQGDGFRRGFLVPHCRQLRWHLVEQQPGGCLFHWRDGRHRRSAERRRCVCPSLHTGEPAGQARPCLLVVDVDVPA